LIGPNARALVDGVRIASLQQDILFAEHDKECGTQGEDLKTFKIYVATILGEIKDLSA